MLLRIVIPSLCLAAFSAAPALSESTLTKPQLETVVQIDALTIPTPGEFFVAMDKQGQPNWTQLFKPETPSATASREQMALMLGVLVADGYIAVEAQDGQGVKNTGKDIINLAKKLNVSQSILGRGNSINDFASNNDWSALREELEATQNEVKLAMAEQKDQDLVILVSLGAWIRGTDVATMFIAGNYSPELAELVRQPAIVSYLLDQVSKLPEKVHSDPLILKLASGLESVRQLVTTDVDVPLPPDSVNALAETLRSMVHAIAEGTKQES